MNCPFCRYNLGPEHRAKVAQGIGWRVTENYRPYPWAERHWLLVCDRHVNTPGELTEQEWAGLGKEVSRIAAGWPHGRLLMRFGDVSKEGGSQTHLHAHVIMSAEDRDAK
jgi:diadenosine tetraphosphate (Ap4A) HIT family hydrolase